MIAFSIISSERKHVCCQKGQRVNGSKYAAGHEKQGLKGPCSDPGRHTGRQLSETLSGMVMYDLIRQCYRSDSFGKSYIYRCQIDVVNLTTAGLYWRPWDNFRTFMYAVLVIRLNLGISQRIWQNIHDRLIEYYKSATEMFMSKQHDHTNINLSLQSFQPGCPVTSVGWTLALRRCIQGSIPGTGWSWQSDRVVSPGSLAHITVSSSFPPKTEHRRMLRVLTVLCG